MSATKTHRKQKQHRHTNWLTQSVTIIACVMAAAYVLIRIFNWIKFF